MFNEIGKKIKKLAFILCVICIGLCIIGGIYIVILGGEEDSLFILIGLAVAVVGSLLAWIGSFLLYGYGELIDNTTNIKELIQSIKNNELKNLQIQTPSSQKKSTPSNSIFPASSKPLGQNVKNNSIASVHPTLESDISKELDKLLASGEIIQEEYSLAIEYPDYAVELINEHK